MRLKRLELFGFKSFAERTVMDFGDDTLTGIVGPNGCGKSNVVDSVRWVLGETRPTSMRGAGMTDVIFKGSASRPPLSVAEVTLVIDNADAALSERGAEVAITRRLFKSGEGEYLIDGERVRLKDVRDLLFDTGLGSRGYAVLEQGRIDAVLSANPLQRRAIFEEAAGISRYRQRRHEAELKLKRVEQDVERLDDLMGELRSRVRSLKIQAGKAERYVAAKTEWTGERRRLLQHRLYALDEGLARVAPELAALEARITELRERRAGCESEALERERERTTVISELDRVSAEAAHLAGEVRAMDERKSQLALRISAWQSSADEERERATSLAELVGERRAELERGRSDLARMDGELEEARGRAEELAGRARALGADYKEVRRSVEAQNEAVLGHLHERTAAQNSAGHMSDAQAPAAERAQRAAERLASLTAAVEAVRGESGAAQEAVGAARTALEVLEAERAERAREQAELDTACERARSRCAELELERAALRARVEALLDRERELADLGGGAQRVLESVASGEGPCPAEAVLGLVADHLTTDTRLARALDAALRERATALVARDEEAALAIVDWCARTESGQVGVVLPAGLAARAEPSPLPAALAGEVGVEGRLSERVECDAALRPLAHALLADVVVVASLDAALALARVHPALVFVTPKGELVDAAGLVGGSREVTQGAVGRRASAAELEAQGVSLTRQIGSLEHDLERKRERAAELAEAAADLERRRDERRAALAEAEANLQTAAARLADLEGSREALELEHARAAEDVARLVREVAEAADRVAEASAAFETENARLSEMEVGRRGLEEERETLAREEGRAQVELARLTSERDALERRIADQERTLAETEAEIARSEERAKTFSESASQGAEEGERIAAEATVALEARGALDGRLEELRAFERSGGERILEVRRAMESVQSDMDAAGETLSEKRLDQQRLGLSRADLVTRAREELDLEEHELSEGFEPDPQLVGDERRLDTLERRVGELKRQLDRLGPVNVDALSELEEVGGRLDFLETQSGDLARARKTLAETIATIDAESTRLFLETFEEVRGNFQRIFRQLFGGGRADVRLVASEEGAEPDPLEAGIEIVARPPGRELLPIGLLSGGQRSMTALALLFAVFDARPSPFCVLDEVDAALDDANIDRFLAMLDVFRRSTQFIVVTHNKGSMTACQSLYGVTMEVKGVSRFVSVELDEVDAFAPQSLGANGRDAESGERVVELVPARTEEAAVEG